jgi:hypothetical protein
MGIVEQRPHTEKRESRGKPGSSRLPLGVNRTIDQQLAGVKRFAALQCLGTQFSSIVKVRCIKAQAIPLRVFVDSLSGLGQLE